jgi:hypothetical protein
MSQYQHEVVTEDGIAITVTRDEEQTDEVYTIQSDDERFLEIFGVDQFELKPGDPAMENAVMGQVVQYNQPKALAIFEAVRKVI